jgi:hypothetical protein
VCLLRGLPGGTWQIGTDAGPQASWLAMDTPAPAAAHAFE